MLVNYIKIAIRNFRRQKLFSFINIFGLALGIAVCLTIFLWVEDELSYNTSHEKYANIYQMWQEIGEFKTTTCPWALKEVLANDFPEFKYTTRFNNRSFLTTYTNKSFTQNIALADKDFFNIFSVQFLHGSPKSSFNTETSAVLTEETAVRFFSNENPIGKVIRINNSFDLTVTGVVKSFPSYSSLQFDILAPVQLFGEERLKSWSVETQIYALVEENVSIDQLSEKISGTTMKYDKRTDQKVVNHLRPLSEIHLYSLSGSDRVTYIYMFSVTAIFILLIACFNFVNLTTARGSRRSKEVGIRKVVGAERKELIHQFFGETLITTAVAVFGGILLAYLFLPEVNNLSQKNLTLNFVDNINLLWGLLFIILITGIVAGIYPSFILSSFKPVSVLKENKSRDSSTAWLRRGLVIIQYTVAVGLIICTLIVYSQMKFINERDLGFNKDNVVCLQMNKELGEKFESFKITLMTNPKILGVTAANNFPTAIGNINPVYWEGHGPDDYEVMNFARVDIDYIKTFDMKIVQGRDFSKNLSTDSTNYVVNEAMVKHMQMSDPIGKMFSIWQNEGKIIGVVKDFHSNSLHNEISPIAITILPNWPVNFAFVRIDSRGTKETLDFLEEKWATFSPGFVFDFQFLDDVFNQRYTDEARMMTLFSYFSVLCIFIACLGLFGLAAYTAEQRTKEFGIRKTLGASVVQIFILMSIRFIVWVAVANIIAWPITFYLMKGWLDEFAYRVDLNFTVFFLAATLSVIISLMSVTYQAIKAALANPINSLRYE